MRLVYLALGWCVGILLAAHATLHIPLLWLALGASALLVLLRTRRLEAGIVLLLTLGGLRMALTPTTSGIAAHNDLGGMTIEGVVASEPDRRDDRVQLRVAVEMVTRAGATLSTDGLVLINAPPLTDARYGDRIQANLFEAGFLCRSDAFQHAMHARASGDPLKVGFGHGVEADIESLQAGLLQRAGMFREQDAVSRHRQIADTCKC